MTFKELYTKLKTLGYPVAYAHFAEGDMPEPPFMIYELNSTDNFSADGVVYQMINEIELELYSKVKDLELENKIETLLSENSIFFEKQEYFLEKANMIQTIYLFDILDN